MTEERERAIELLKENLCAICAYGSQSMASCDIRGEFVESISKPTGVNFFDEV